MEKVADLVDVEWQKLPQELPEPIKPNNVISKVFENMQLLIGEFDDIKTALRVLKNGKVEVKCECGGNACPHIAALFKHAAESGLIKNNIIDIKEEQKQKAIEKFKTIEAEEQALILKADELDEQLILKEQVLGAEPLVYRIPTKKGDRYILSVRGWTQAMLYQGNIEVVDVKFEEIEGRAIAKAIVRDTARNIQQIGIAERYINEEFKWTTLASKAIRNALKKVISPAIEQRVIKEALEAKAVIDLSLAEIREVAER